jgi:large subunit ribosomal protein L19
LRLDNDMIPKMLALVESKHIREDRLVFEIGDTVDVHTRIQEGEKERIQIFTGIVIARRGGGTRENFTVRRIVAGEGVERTFPINSPKIAKVDVKRHGKVRRAKLFFLRDRVGKATKLVERVDAAEREAANQAKKARKGAAAAEARSAAE